MSGCGSVQYACIIGVGKNSKQSMSIMRRDVETALYVPPAEPKVTTGTIGWGTLCVNFSAAYARSFWATYDSTPVFLKHINSKEERRMN